MEDLRSSLNPKSTQNLTEIFSILIFVSDFMEDLRFFRA